MFSAHKPFGNPPGMHFDLPHYTALLLALGLLGASHLQAQSLSVEHPSTLSSSNAGSSTKAVFAPLPEAPVATTSEDRNLADPDTAKAEPFGTLPSPAADAFPALRQREHSFLSQLLGPTAFIAPAFQAGIDTIRPLKVGYPSDGFIAPGQHPAHGDVPEWGEGAQGYAKRYADRFGQGLVSTTSRYALGEALRQDVTYHRCGCTGLLPRTGHALAGAYLARTREGRTVPSVPALASPFIASEVAVSAWYPSRYNTSDALRGSVLNYVAAPFRNLFAEFVAR